MNSYETLVDEIANRQSIKFVIIAILWTKTLYPIPGYIEQRTFDNGEGGAFEGTRYSENVAVTPKMEFQVDASAKREAILSFIGSLNNTGKNIVIQYPVPETGWNIPELVMKDYIRGISPEIVTTDYAAYEKRNRFIISVLDSLGTKIERFIPAKVLCDSFVRKRCVAMLDGRPLYRDDNHLNDFGVQLIVPDLMKIIDERSNPAASLR